MNLLRKNKVFVLVLTALFAFNAVGFAFEAHYCEGELQSISFFGKAEACEMSKQMQAKMKPCCKKKQHRDGFSKKGCCSSEMHYLNALQDFQSEDGLSIEAAHNFSFQAVNLTNRHSSVISHLARIHHLHLDIPPPRTEKSKYIFNQVLRI